MSANNACRECGVASMGPRNCAHCGAMNCMTTPDVDTLRAEVERLTEERNGAVAALRRVLELRGCDCCSEDGYWEAVVEAEALVKGYSEEKP